MNQNSFILFSILTLFISSTVYAGGSATGYVNIGSQSMSGSMSNRYNSDSTSYIRIAGDPGGIRISARDNANNFFFCSANKGSAVYSDALIAIQSFGSASVISVVKATPTSSTCAQITFAQDSRHLQ